MNAEVIYGSEIYFKSLYEALTAVARERIYIEMIEPPAFDKVCEFQRDLIKKNIPTYYAVHNKRVVGWCDVFPSDNPRQSHRGSLGMGILPEFRGQGIGTKLVDAVLRHAKVYGLEKVELNVYTSNKAAVALYKKCGFEEEGLIKQYRKLDGQIYDSLIMAKYM